MPHLAWVSSHPFLSFPPCIQMLAVLFRRFAGFHEIRLAGQRGIAFIEFRDEVSARTAFQAYNGFKLSQTDALKLTYAKR